MDMKKIILTALVIVASAAFCPSMAQTKKGKKKGKAEVELAQKNDSLRADSLSYAQGMVSTNGLLPFLRQNYGVDESMMDDFLSGYAEAMANTSDARLRARAAGVQVAHMMQERVMPGARKELSGLVDSLHADAFNRGFIAALRHDNSVMTDSAAQAQLKQARTQQSDAVKKVGTDFLAANAKKKGVQTTASGLQYRIIKQGNGPVAKADDEVVVRYEGRQIDGTVFDSSYNRKPDTATFKPSQVIKGWTEALTMMPAGSTWELFIPQNLAYGERAMGDKIPAYSTLIFTVEVVEVKAK